MNLRLRINDCTFENECTFEKECIVMFLVWFVQIIS